jgi:hypothetical protein
MDPKSIDERLEVLLGRTKRLLAESKRIERRSRQRFARAQKNWQDLEHFRRSMRAGYQQYLREKGGSE